MNDETKKIVDRLFDKEEWLQQLSLKTDRSIKTIRRHYIGKEYKIPIKFQLIAFDLATKLYKKQMKRVSNMKVNF